MKAVFLLGWEFDVPQIFERVKNLSGTISSLMSTGLSINTNIMNPIYIFSLPSPLRAQVCLFLSVAAKCKLFRFTTDLFS